MFRYIPVSEELSSPILGQYHSFGIAAQKEVAGHWQTCCQVSDISTDPTFVDLRRKSCGALYGRAAGAGPFTGCDRGCADLRAPEAPVPHTAVRALFCTFLQKALDLKLGLSCTLLYRACTGEQCSPVKFCAVAKLHGRIWNCGVA